MAKDPAFLFYSQDWLVGTMTLSFEDKGKFINILAMMHQQGRMNEETIRFLVGSISDSLRLKFCVDGEGFWYNERLEKESKIRKNFTESRRKNGSKGGRPKKIKENKQKPYGYDMVNHMEDEDENENENENKDINEVIFPFFSENFKRCWRVWGQFKYDHFKFRYKSPKSEQAALKRLSEIAKDEDMAVRIIEQSIANGWKGLFELNENKNGKERLTTQQLNYLASRNDL